MEHRCLFWWGYESVGGWDTRDVRGVWEGSWVENDISSVASFKGTEHEYTKVVTEPLTQYIWIYSIDPPAGEKTVKITCAYYSPVVEGREISEGEDVKAVGVDYLYYSFTLSSDKTVTVVSSDNAVQVLDSKKEDLGAYATKDEAAIVNLKKGTYYLKVGSGITNFKYTTSSLSLGKNVTKKKAKKAQLGKAIKMKFAASNSKSNAYYYKIKVTKSKKISINVSASKLLSPVNVKLYKTKYETIPYLEGYNEDNNGKVNLSGQIKKGASNYILYKKSVKIPAGTYYLEVDTRSSGDCKVTVK